MRDPKPDKRCICGDPALSAIDLSGTPAIETTGYGVGLATACDATGDVVGAGGDGATNKVGATNEVGATDGGAGSSPQPQTATAATTATDTASRRAEMVLTPGVWVSRRTERSYAWRKTTNPSVDAIPS